MDIPASRSKGLLDQIDSISSVQSSRNSRGSIAEVTTDRGFISKKLDDHAIHHWERCSGLWKTAPAMAIVSLQCSKILIVINVPDSQLPVSYPASSLAMQIN